MRGTVLFLPTHQASINEMHPVALSLKRGGRFQPVYVLTRKKGVTRDSIARLERDGCEVVDLTDSNAGLFPCPPAPQARLVDITLGLGRKIPRASTFFSWSIDIREKLRVATHLIREKGALALAVVGDRTIGWETCFIKAAANLGIPSVVVPFAIYHPNGGLLYRKSKPDYQDSFCVNTLFKKAVAKLWPAWVLKTNEDRVFMHPLPQALAAAAMGVMSAKPWVLGGGYSARVLAESEYVRDTLIEYGADPDKIKVTGKPALDRLAADLAAQRDEAARAGGKTVILFAVPPHAEHGFMTWEQHFALLHRILSMMTRVEGVDVMVNLHPRSDPGDYRSFLEQYPVRYEARSIYELLGQCDLFVAGPSSTVMPALSMGKPVLCLDYHLGDLSYLPSGGGLTVVTSTRDIEREFEAFLRAHQEAKSGPGRPGSYWAMLDGGSTRRVVEALTAEVERAFGSLQERNEEKRHDQKE